ncbi:MAG: 4-alpha-glucanotransferase [Ichthyobacteriaceae bacterium]|nr:4-alpha-glucanotransferase [Ichthyobacteriaceae bacterium]
MKILHILNCNTQWGQTAFLDLNLIDKEGVRTVESYKMAYENNIKWWFKYELNTNKYKSANYSFYIKNEIGEIEKEWEIERVLPYTNEKTIVLRDDWRSISDDYNAFYTSAFKEVLFNEKEELTPYVNEGNLLLNIRVPFKLPNLRIGIIGSSNTLGKWKTDRIIKLNHTADDIYSVKFYENDFPLEYKYCLLDVYNKVIEIEDGDNRVLNVPSSHLDISNVVVNNEHINIKNNRWKGAGVAIPVFSLRTENSCGVGEFNDIKTLVDWAVKTNLKLIQVLPINDTTANHSWYDSFPYSAISIYALHPMYLNLEKAGTLASVLTRDIITELKEELNSYDYVEYHKVMALKRRFIKQLYLDGWQDLRTDLVYNKFIDDNAYWLKSYASFCFLRDMYGTAEFNKWGEYSEFSVDLMNELTDENSLHFEDIEVHYFTQYHLHLQLLEAKEYASEKGVLLKGDIPIGIFRNSVEAWSEPHLFNMEMQAGAPPDDFSGSGQNWGFPTYNWEEMAKDNYGWWTRRMVNLSQYFDSFRIDHILGFFRIWQVPMDSVEGVMGYFYPAIPITLSELSLRDLSYNIDRFANPYIRDHILWDVFEGETGFVKHKFLIEEDSGFYSFKPEFSTQINILKYFYEDKHTTEEVRVRNSKIKDGLFGLISNVLLIEVEGVNGQKEYHPRHSLQKTTSYAELDDYLKGKINELYDDYFFHRQEDFWKESAMLKLPTIKHATEMLICGEDLGMVPAVVPGVMKDLGMLSLEIQRMPKAQGIEFFHPKMAPYLSVVTSSSHDMSTIRGWWEEDKYRTQRYFNQILNKKGESPEVASGKIVTDIVDQHLNSDAMWTILPIQDYIGMDESFRRANVIDEQINNPSVTPHFWKYRLHLNIEDLMQKDDFNTELANMVSESGR